MKRVSLLLPLLLAACRQDSLPAPTAEEAAQLNEADAMLNELAKEEGPEANAPDPSENND